jgi:hypothetical protein
MISTPSSSLIPSVYLLHLGGDTKSHIYIKQQIKLITHSLTHGAEPFLRSCQLCSHSRTSRRFMETEGSLPPSQKPSTGPYPEPDRSNPTIPSYLSKIHFNIVHPPTSFFFFFFYLFFETIGPAATPGLLCQPRVIMEMIVESRWNVGWQGKPKFSEKTCPSATFVHHKIPHA